MAVPSPYAQLLVLLIGSTHPAAQVFKAQLDGHRDVAVKVLLAKGGFQGKHIRVSMLGLTLAHSPWLTFHLIPIMPCRPF